MSCDMKGTARCVKLLINIPVEGFREENKTEFSTISCMRKHLCRVFTVC